MTIVPSKSSSLFSQAYVRGDIEAMLDMRGRDELREYWSLPPGLQVLEHAAAADRVVVVGSTAERPADDSRQRVLLRPRCPETS